PNKPKKLDEYKGAFSSAEAQATITFEIKGDKLILRTRRSELPLPVSDSDAGHGWFPLDCICKDAFKNEWIGLLRFNPHSNGQIAGFTISNFAGGVRHLAFQKCDRASQ